MSQQPTTDLDARMMAEALKMAARALDQAEFPVGCVIADRGRVVARGHRTGTATEAENELDHAEINALRQLGLADAPVDRSGLVLYSTMEPCLMCFAAILLSGIGRIVYAYEDVMGGGTGCDRSAMTPLYRDAPLTVTAGVLREQSLALFRRFFEAPGTAYWGDSLLCRYTLAQPISV